MFAKPILEKHIKIYTHILFILSLFLVPLNPYK